MTGNHRARDGISYPLPTYLLQAGDAQQTEQLNLNKVDKNLIHGQILTFADTIEKCVGGALWQTFEPGAQPGSGRLPVLGSVLVQRQAVP